MDTLLIALGRLVQAGLAITVVWWAMVPGLWFGAADWPGYLETHFAVLVLGLGLASGSCAAFVVALIAQGVWCGWRAIRRPRRSPSSAQPSI